MSKVVTAERLARICDAGSIVLFLAAVALKILDLITAYQLRVAIWTACGLMVCEALLAWRARKTAHAHAHAQA